ncbi:MAG: hypothetical protein IJK60_06120 [Clostridia bacterium]|nr:hypothetical protein [Clostridia bacterium]
MSFIRNKSEERTGYQQGGSLKDSFNNQCDFVMVYRINETTAERAKQYRDKGYVVHLMTGIAWGSYTDYLNGEWDGINHWDEAQKDRYGNLILHSEDSPYMVPTVSFADYMSEKLRIAVDCGVEAIHVEEPEFWDRAGYSESFKREYQLYYRLPWSPPHESVDAKYRCSKLKAYLYARTIDRVASSLKEYAKVKYNRYLRFYVPTHSLINYTQWKIVSPEGKLADIPAVDGCIAQVWTGTSREKNWFDGEFKERTFETAYLEYGVMQELVKGTDRKMWFLHDPIEDNPVFDWDDYRKNYLCTVAASLLHPKINSYEICPWPNRVFEDEYPKGSPEARRIPDEYATLLNNMFNTLGNIENMEEKGIKVGILTADSQLYQREYPDCFFVDAKVEETGTVLHEADELIDRFRNELFKSEKVDSELLLKYMSANALPAFYSLALPLLKYGISVRPVLLDNARRYPGYLDDYDVIIMSYEYMKPDYPDVNTSITNRVRQGAVLIYIGDGFDPFHKINSWWSEKYDTPADHLFEMLEINPDEKGIYKCGKGVAGVWKMSPCFFGFSKENADLFRQFFIDVTAEKGYIFEFSNHLSISRKPYIITAVMDESVDSSPVVLKGLYADMFTPDFKILTEKTVYPGENSMLCDLKKIGDESLCVIGTSSRINSMERNGSKITINAHGAGSLTANIRLRVPTEVKSAEIDGEKCRFVFDDKSRTVLLTYESNAKPVNITVELE